jgi:hypothetical protein
MHVRWIAASVFVACSGVARAQSPAVLARSDAAFASALKRAGYADMAEKLLDTIEKSGKLGADEAIDVKALHLDLRLDIAQREPDPLKRKDALRGILQEKEDLVEQYKGRKVAEDAANSLPDVYRMLGEAISIAVQREQNVELVKQLQKEGAEIYNKAEERLKARIEALKAADSSTPGVEDQLIAVLYNLPRTMYFHALLYNKDEFKRKDLLEQAIKGFQEFGLDHGDLLLNYEGLIYEGLCHKELGDTATAKSAFMDAFTFPKTLDLPKSPKGEYELAQSEADTVSSAALQLINLLAELKDYPAALTVAKEFFDTTPGVFETRSGLAILAAKAEVLLAMGDTKGASDAADKLVEEDPRGPWGSKGRELQGKLVSGGGAIDPDKLLKIASTYNARGDTEHALQFAHVALNAARGNPKEAQIGTDAYGLIGSIFQGRGWMHEAALAYDAGADKYPSAENAPMLMSNAIKCYLAINKDDKSPYYKKRIDDRNKTLATKYANSPFAQAAQLTEAKQLVNEGKLLEAADQFTKVLPTSPNYLEAQVLAGDAYFKYSLELAKDKNKATEAQTYSQQAETLLKKILGDLEKKIPDILEIGERGRFESLGLNARGDLAQLYLRTNRPAEVLALLEGADERYAQNDSALNSFWSFRIQAYLMLGKLDEAIAKLDALAKKDPKSKAIPGAAKRVAAELDTQATALREKDKKIKEADETLKRAAQYYAMAGRALLTQDTPNVKDAEAIATRLLNIGLIINNVPEKQTSFVGWDPKSAKDGSLWQLSAELFAATLKLVPSYKSQVLEGRAYGFVGQYDKAAAVLGELFDAEKVLNVTDKKLNMALMKSKPELFESIFEYGVSEHEVARADSDTDRYRRAQDVFDVLAKALPAGQCSWWQAQYYALRNLTDAGNYNRAKNELATLERTTNDLGATCNLADKFKVLKDDLANK